MNLLSDYLKKRFSNKQVWIVGLGREGISSYSLLRAYLPDLEIILFDDLSLEQLPAEIHTYLEHPHTKLASGNDINSLPHDQIVGIKTPGISSNHPVITRLAERKIEITSNTQLFFDILKETLSSPTTIGITGTKGKSTTTSMIYHVLKENGKIAFLAGNIGTPPLDLVEEIISLENPKSAYVVLEMSSHQLRELTTSPQIAVIQNITPEHLDYYPNFGSYQKAKQSITKYQNKDNYVIFCPRFDAVVNILSEFAQQLTFDVEPQSTDYLTAYASSDAIYYGTEKVINITEIPLVGKHNLYNTLPSVIVGHLAGLSNSQIAQAIRSFKGLEHRLEFVVELEGVRYYNDSQATTPEAAIAALQSFKGAPIHLLAGGSDKGVDLSQFAKEILQNRVKTLVLFPPMGEVIEQLVQHHLKPGQLVIPSIFHVKSMQDAVKIAKEHATTGDVVLLSPACASFGLFKNYQDRGNQFKKEVLHVT